MKYWKEGSVHCLKSDYVISDNAAKKYGYTGAKTTKHIANVVNGAFLSQTYPNVPNIYKYSSDYAKFDMGSTGAVLYPTQIVANSVKNFIPIDFGHEDFFFTEENRKTLAQMNQ